MPETELFREISSLLTEQRNASSMDIDLVPTYRILEIINEEDQKVALAVKQELPYIEQAVERIVQAFKSGGRLFYFGAGTSGRLGVVDASECPPTFGSTPEMVQGFIAGGNGAMFQAQEGAEDKPENGAEEILKNGINTNDVVCGIAASGRTPYVRGVLDEAKKHKIFTILVTTSNREILSELGMNADVMICPNVGPEVITGSTRMKSGTAQKMVLNMLTTAAMVQLGKTYSNVMVDLQLTNNKLKERAKKILMELCGITYDQAEAQLEKSQGHVKTAMLMTLANVDLQTAQAMLEKSNGFIRKALNNI